MRWEYFAHSSELAACNLQLLPLVGQHLRVRMFANYAIKKTLYPLQRLVDALKVLLAQLLELIAGDLQLRRRLAGQLEADFGIAALRQQPLQ